MKKEIIPEWKPILKDSKDVDNFDAEFTSMGIKFYLEPNYSFV